MNTMHNGWIRSVSWARLAGVTRPAVNLFYCTGLALVLTLALAPRAEAAGPYYVALSGSGGNGLSWGTAYTNVQTAIDAAADGETIYLKGETFTLPTNSVNGKLVWTNKGLTILGGYAADGGSPGALTNTPTVLLNTGAAYSNLYRVLYISGVTNGTLRNLTIRGGQVGNQTPDVDPNPRYGAGIYMANCSNMLFDAVTLDGNYNYGQQSQSVFGGGLYANNCWGLMTNCVIRNNWLRKYYGTYSYGAGLHLQGGGWTLRDCVVRDNTMSYYGGSSYTSLGVGLYINGGAHSVKNCVLARNVSNVTFGQYITTQGEGLYIAAGTVTLENCTVYWHPYEGLRLAGGSMGVTNCILWANGTYDIVGVSTGAVAYSDIGVGDRAFTNNANFSADPLFERGFYLATNSPCVNAGSQSASAAGLDGRTTRADGTADGGTVDLGYHYAGGVEVPNLYVSVNSGNDGNTGTAPGAGNAFKTIGKALATAGDGTRIYIESGNYTTNTETFPLTAANKLGLQLLGTNSATTVLNPAGTKRGVVFSYVYPDARLSGLSVTNAYFYDGSAYGAGVYLVHSKISIEGCNISYNWTHTSDASWGWGYVGAAGLYAVASEGVITNCTFRNNRADTSYNYSYSGGGGGVHLEGTWDVHATEIAGNEFSLGTEWGGRVVDGGGLYLNGTITLRNCLLANNWAHRSDNSATYECGDGVYVAGGVARFENCTIATNKGEGIRQAGGTVAVTNSILWGNGVDANGTVTAAWSDIGVAGSAVTLVSCLSTNPLFLSPATNNYRLAEGSPCINAGLTLSWMTGAADLDGQRRIMEGRVDMGCYEAMPPAGAVIMFW